MCGIVALIGSREASPLLLEGLKKLEYRGYDSAGIAVVDNREQLNLVSIKAEGKLNNLIEIVNKSNVTGNLGIGHTRWATHGKPEKRNAHPHLDTLQQVAVVQNGIIENYKELRTQLESEGILFVSDTDTEVLPHLISRELDFLKKDSVPINSSSFLKAVENILPKLEGSYAFAAVFSQVPDALVLAKKHAPLIIGFGEGEFLCASDTPALAGFTRTILPMEDNEIALLTPLGVELYDSKGVRQERNPTFINNVDFASDKKNFRHFMLKEIHEQPQIVQSWIDKYFPVGVSNENSLFSPLEDSLYKSIDQINILSCGTSRHASMVGAYLLEQFAGISTSVFYASEFRYAPPPLTPNTLTIGVTQSGETADTLAALSMDKKRRNELNDLAYSPLQLGITNRPESSLGREVSQIIDIDTGIEVAVAATKTFIGQLLSFYGLAIVFASKKETRSNQEIGNLIEEIRTIPGHLRQLLSSYNEITESLACNFVDTKDVIFLGRGINYPIALEGALKLKEISYIHAQGYPAGELKHGPIALLEKNIPVVSIAVPGLVFDKVLSNAQEAKARDAQLIGVAPESKDTEFFDHCFYIPNVNELLSPLLTILPLQLFSYHIAAHKGLDVDQPRNLAKSVTVE